MRQAISLLLFDKMFKKEYNNNMTTCLSVKTPYAYQIVAGIKDVENRSWTTQKRGDIYIHASGNEVFYDIDISYYPKKVQEELKEGAYKDKQGKCKKNAPGWYKNMYNFYHTKVMPFYGFTESAQFVDFYKMKKKDLTEKYKPFFLTSAIIGKVKIIDIQKGYDSLFSDKDCYNWILDSPGFFDKPITQIKGHLNLWKYNQEV